MKREKKKREIHYRPILHGRELVEIISQSLALQGLLRVTMVIMGFGAMRRLMVDIVVLVLVMFILVVLVLVALLGCEMGDTNNVSGGDTGTEVTTDGVKTGLGHGGEGVVGDVKGGLLKAWVCGVVVLLLGLEGLDGVGLDFGRVGHFFGDVFVG